MTHYQNLKMACLGQAYKLLELGYEVHTNKWQSIDVSKTMIEIFEQSFKVPLEVDSKIASDMCLADQPWADEHFKERVGGKPLNPGETYKIWPYYKEDETWRKDSRFSHTYMERFWPKFAGDENPPRRDTQNTGVRYKYGDLKDVINLLRNDIHTRQAYLPIWFPEDTGAKDNQRLPCTLGYLFNYRNGYFHCTYYIRSCDMIRHFHNDLYLTNKLAVYVLNDLQRFFLSQYEIKPGFLTWHCSSLHIFESEKFRLRERLCQLEN